MIGLYIAFVLPIILRLKAGEKFERGAWHLGRHYKWIDSIAIALDRLHLHRVHAPVAPTAASRGTTGFDWNLVNYTPFAVGAAFLLFGGWYVLSARKWFKGPIQHGHRGGDGARSSASTSIRPAARPHRRPAPDAPAGADPSRVRARHFLSTSVRAVRSWSVWRRCVQNAIQ